MASMSIRHHRYDRLGSNSPAYEYWIPPLDELRSAEARSLLLVQSPSPKPRNSIRQITTASPRTQARLPGSPTVRIVSNSPRRQSAYQTKPLPALPPECPSPLSVRPRPTSMRPSANNRTANNAMSPTPKTKVQKNSTSAPKIATHAAASMSSLTHAHPLRSNPVFEQEGQRQQLQRHQPEMSRIPSQPRTTQNFEEMERKIATMTGTPMANVPGKPAGPRFNHAGGARNQHLNQGDDNKRDSTFSRFRNRVKQGLEHHHLRSSKRNLRASSSTSSLESTLSNRSLDEDTDMDKRISRRIAEGDNLRKRKVQVLVGDGKVRRKPVPQGSSVRNSMIVAEGLPVIPWGE